MVGTARGDEDPEVWFGEHYDDAADQILEFLGSDGWTLEGKRVVDIGAGDGIIDLGLAVKGRPELLVGYDVRKTDVDALRRSAEAAGVEEYPESLAFDESAVNGLPAPNHHFDIAVTWSAFEHVTFPVRMLSEIRRIIKPDGVLFLQLWPFYYSEHGGHLWPHYDEPFPHLRRTDEEVRADIVGRRATDPTRDAGDEYDSLNRITLDDLQRALLSAGFITVKLEVLCNAIHIPTELAHLPLSHVGLGGVKLLAIPRS